MQIEQFPYLKIPDSLGAYSANAQGKVYSHRSGRVAKYGVSASYLLKNMRVTAAQKSKYLRTRQSTYTQASIEIHQYTKEGVYVASFNSTVAASTQLNISNSGISNNIAGRSKSSGGFIWSKELPFAN